MVMFTFGALLPGELDFNTFCHGFSGKTGYGGVVYEDTTVVVVVTGFSFFPDDDDDDDFR